MFLKNTYVVGCLVQFYELGLVSENVRSLMKMLEGIENTENVHIHYCFSQQQYLEEIDWQAIKEGFKSWGKYKPVGYGSGHLNNEFKKVIAPLLCFDCKISIEFKDDNDPFFNIAHARRDLNYNWCEKVDIVIWNEVDSLLPSQTLRALDALHETVKGSTPKYIANFAGRKNWDASWDIITHPLFRNVQFQDNEEWALTNEASEKSYMSQGRMEEINAIPFESIIVDSFTTPKADGSCLVISSDLIKSGCNIAHSVWLASEDTAFLDMAKLIMGDQFVQFHFRNLLRVHNRRHPNKRRFVKGENNPHGFCDERKGDQSKEPFWKKVETASKQNASNIRKQERFIKFDEVIK